MAVVTISVQKSTAQAVATEPIIVAPTCIALDEVCLVDDTSVVTYFSPGT